MIRGEDVHKALHDVSLEPGATADEKHRLGHLTYYLTAATAQDIADRLNGMSVLTAEDDLPGDLMYLASILTAHQAKFPVPDHIPAKVRMLHRTAERLISDRAALQSARDRIVDMLKGDDGQAWKEAEKALPAIEKALKQ